MKDFDERVKLSKEEAREMLVDSDSVHTFRQAGQMLIGADWSREDMFKAINTYDFELTGERAANMNHGMAFHDENGAVFVETKKK